MKHLIILFALLTAVTGKSQVVINEVYPTTNQIELKNIGNDVINLTGGRIWDAMQGDLTLGTSVPTECGDFILTPEEITVFTFNGPLSNAGGQLLLEFASGTPTAYLQWGGSQSLVTFAFSMGLWDDPALFVPTVPSGSSIELIDPENRRNPEGYFLQANPSICDDNITCSITEVTLRDITCENAQTPSDPSDDYFTFVPFVEGVNLNGNIELSIPGIDISPNTVTPECASCLVGTEPGSATGEDYELTLTANDGECETTVVLTAPENCSPVCDIVYHQIINLECNDNDTGASTDDDYLEFLFQAWGFNLSESGYYLIFPNGTEQGPFTYNNAHPISTQGIVPAGSGDFPIIVEDASDATCRKTVTVLDPGSCSDGCLLTTTELSIDCNNNGTPSDQTDDFYELTLEMAGVNVTGFYNANIGPFANEVLSLSYDSLYQFSTPPGSAPDLEFFAFSFLDDEEPCTGLTLNGMFEYDCAVDCLLTTTELSIDCNNNGTPSDQTDDFYELTLEMAGVNVTGFYNANIGPFANEVLSLSYDSLYLFSTPPGSAPDLEFFAFSFLDEEEPCTGLTLNGMFEYDCAVDCLLTTTELSIDCNNNGTPSDQTDDFYELTLEMAGVNVTGFYNANIGPFANEVLSLSYDSLYLFSTPPGSAPDLEFFAFSFLDEEEPCTGLTLNGMFEYDCVITNNLEIIENDKVLISPNPVASTLHFTLADQLLADPSITVELRNMQSTVVYKSPYRDIIDLSTLAAGVYVVTLRSSSWVNRQIIIKS